MYTITHTYSTRKINKKERSTSPSYSGPEASISLSLSPTPHIKINKELCLSDNELWEEL